MAGAEEGGVKQDVCKGVTEPSCGGTQDCKLTEQSPPHQHTS
jgi:hypothetical protein